MSSKDSGIDNLCDAGRMSQTDQVMLVQANQQPQSILPLLQQEFFVFCTSAALYYPKKSSKPDGFFLCQH